MNALSTAHGGAETLKIIYHSVRIVSVESLAVGATFVIPDQPESGVYMVATDASDSAYCVVRLDTGAVLDFFDRTQRVEPVSALLSVKRGA